jgi:hypothetical protein
METAPETVRVRSASSAIVAPMRRPAPSFLDRAFEEILDGRSCDAVPALFAELESRRATLTPSAWERFVVAARQHPLHVLLQQEPITRRAFTKPRGYAGDAELLDLIYGEADLPDDTSCVGACLFAEIYEAGCGKSVRFRRALLAGAIDDAAADSPGARVLSLACGHLREAEDAASLRAGALGELIAVDADTRALAHVEQTFAGARVTPMAASVKDILGGRVAESSLDLVYAASIYDTLPAATAIELTARLFEMLRPGGRLLVANFAPTPFAGYMDAFMDWRLRYRSEADVAALFSEVPERDLCTCKLRRDPLGHVVYATATRA